MLPLRQPYMIELYDTVRSRVVILPVERTVSSIANTSVVIILSFAVRTIIPIVSIHAQWDS